MRNLGIVALCAALAGCNAQANTSSEDPPVWGRVDCQRSEGNPILSQEFELARQICASQAEAAAVAGTANMRGGYGIAGGIAAGINQGITAGNISRATGTGCMGERGYMLRPLSEHLAACEAIQEQKDRMAAAAKPEKRTGSPKAARSPSPTVDAGSDRR
jgi:phage gpG-like protein